MGCGGSRGGAGQTPTTDLSPATESASADGGTWATKTDPSLASTALPTSAAEVPKNQTTHTQAVVLQELDDNIDIVGEEAPSRNSPPAAKRNSKDKNSGAQENVGLQNGNGGAWPAQESPNRGAAQTAPLPVQQQKEAAKLEETRKRFEQRQLQQQQGLYSPTSIVPTPTAEAAEARGARPVEQNLVGLSLNNNSMHTERQNDPLGAFLPGGIFDDDIQLQMPQTTKVQAKHFDDDDEALMAEILSDLDCA